VFVSPEGNQGVCLICKANCQISALSDKVRCKRFLCRRDLILMNCP